MKKTTIKMNGVGHDDPIIPKTVKRTLRYDFSAVEIHDLSMSLASTTKQLQALEEEKSSVTAQYGSKIKESKATCNKLSNLVSDGYEFRETELTIDYHLPEQGKKTLTRLDNGAKIVEKMEQFEWNLFNQPEDIK